MEHKVTIRPILIGVFGTVTKGLLKGVEALEVGGRVETILIENGQNSGKSPGDLRRLALTRTPVKKLSAKTEGKNSQGVNNNYNNDNNGTHNSLYDVEKLKVQLIPSKRPGIVIMNKKKEKKEKITVQWTRPCRRTTD